MSEHIKWTPEQFWEYVEGLAGDFNAGQMREMLAERGLSLAAPQTRTCNHDGINSERLPDWEGSQSTAMTGTLRFVYKNYRNEISEREARPISIRFGSSEYHKAEQWLMLAFDLEKNAEREFAMRDMGFISSSESKFALSAAPVSARQDNHLGIVLSALRHLEEATGESFDDEGGDIAAIEREHKARALARHDETSGGARS